MLPLLTSDEALHNLGSPLRASRSLIGKAGKCGLTYSPAEMESWRKGVRVALLTHRRVRLNLPGNADEKPIRLVLDRNAIQQLQKYSNSAPVPSCVAA